MAPLLLVISSLSTLCCLLLWRTEWLLSLQAFGLCHYGGCGLAKAQGAMMFTSSKEL